MTLRDYQETAVAAALSHFEAGKSALIVMPTGTGKTVVFAELARRFRPHGRTLILAHREELIRQAAATVAKRTGLEVDVEMADEHAVVHSLYKLPDVVVASVATLVHDRRRARFKPTDFDLIVVDEAHHAPAKSYRKIVAHFPGAKLLGVTATPDRLDKKGLGALFEACVYTYEIQQAIHDGWLVAIRQTEVQIDGLSLDGVAFKGGDFTLEGLSAEMLVDARLYAVAEPLLSLSNGRRTLVFATTVGHAHKLAEVLNAKEADCALALDGSAESWERARGLDAFRTGKVRFLVNCALFTEGFDEWSISCVASARPTHSRTLYAQMIGRGTRICPACQAVCDHKRDLHVIDFTGDSQKHALISPIDVLAGSHELPEVMAQARKIARKSPGMDTQTAIALGRQKVQQLLDQKAKRKAAKEANVKYTTIEVDPFCMLGEKRKTMGRLESASPALRKRLASFGVPEKDIDTLTPGAAGVLMQRCIARRRADLCTYKQSKILERYNYDTTHLGFREASALIDRLVANNWRKVG